MLRCKPCIVNLVINGPVSYPRNKPKKNHTKLKQKKIMNVKKEIINGKPKLLFTCINKILLRKV
jgi:hypothetical protein